MTSDAKKRYKIYEYIRNCDIIKEEMSNTKKLIIKLMENDEQTINYCKQRMLEEKREVEEAIEGRHFHKNMTKREILINEISQYIYWQTIIAISQNISCGDFDEESKIKDILKNVDLNKIEESKPIDFKEIILHDLNQMKQKDYLKGVI